jgi:hypothetical protein
MEALGSADRISDPLSLSKIGPVSPHGVLNAVAEWIVNDMGCMYMYSRTQVSRKMII